MVEFDDVLYSRCEFYKFLNVTKKHGYMLNTGDKIRPTRDAIFLWDGKQIVMSGFGMANNIGFISNYEGE